jgi:hypothetical protein
MCLVPSTGRRRQGHPAGGAPAGSAGEQCACAKQRTMLSLLQEASLVRQRYTDLRRQDTRGLPPAANIYSPKCYILYVPRPTCRGSVPLCKPPSAIKGEACDVTGLRPNSRQTLSSSYKLPSNTSHSGVGYAPVARTTLNPRVLSCVDPPVS